MSESRLNEAFLRYCRFGGGARASCESQLDNVKWAKLCKDANLIDKSFSKTDVDLVWSKVKPKGARKVDFFTFQKLLHAVAEKKQITFDQLSDRITSKGPSCSGTKTDDVRLADKESFIGVAKQGGPSTKDAQVTLFNLLDRTPADARGRKLDAKSIM